MERKRISESDFHEFLKQEYPDDKPWKGFFKLWLDAKGFDYGDREQHIVDGCGDGGIDAIAYPPHGHTELPILVVQSKYYRSKIPEGQLKAFIAAVAAFRSDSRGEFEHWLTKVKNNKLKTVYRDLWPKRHNIKFVVVTSGSLKSRSLSDLAELDVEIEDKKQVNAVFFDMALGKSPRPEKIRLRKIGNILPILKNENHNMYVFSAPLVDFAKAYQAEKKNLFAGNVRYALPGKTEVKVGIKKTLDRCPEEFAYFHNGITVVCKKVKRRGGYIELHSPSIVNGAQTVSYVGESLHEQIPKSASVLVKCIEVKTIGGFEEYETDVAMSSNTQNKVSLSDLSVIDPDLVKIERFFRTQNCFLERKRGATPLGVVDLKTNKDRMLQLFASLDPKLGPATIKDKQELYRNHSGRLFEFYANSMERKRDAVFIAKLDKFVKSSLQAFQLSGRSGKRKRRRLSLSYFTIFTLVALLIREKKKWRDLRSEFHSEGIWGNRYSRALERDVRKIAMAVLATGKRDPDRNETAFYKNREKVNGAIIKLRRKMRPKLTFHRH